MIIVYLIFLFFFIAVRVIAFPQAVVFLMNGIIAVCQAAMFFLAGRHIAGCLRKADTEKDPDHFKTTLVKWAGLLFLAYVILGVPSLYLLQDQDLFLSIRNVLAFNIVPDTCGILASLGFLYLIATGLIPFLARHPKGKVLAGVITAAGFLLTFIPSRIIGYAFIGIFIGGDKFGCIPIATHLFPFFWGIYNEPAGKLTIKSVKDRVNLFSLLGLAGLSVLFVLLWMDRPFYVTAGSFGAFFLIIILDLFAPLKEKIIVLSGRLKGWLGESVILLDGPARGRVFSRRNLRCLVIYLAGYTVLFLITALLVFLPIIQMHKSLVWTGDALSQYIPKLHRFLRYVPEVFRCLASGDTDIPVYDYTSGMGSTVSITFEPLYWLYLILPKKNLDATYTFLHILRFFLAGLSFSQLAIYFRRSWLASWTASLAYAFSGFAVFAGTRHFTFINTMILLPLLVVGIERIIRHRKWYMFTVAVALSLLCSYYFLYMNTIVLGLYFISRILCTKEYRNFKTFFTRGLIIAGSYLLGCSMGVISIATHFGGYLSSGRSEGNKLDALLAGFNLYYRQSWISDLFLSSINYTFTPGQWLKIGTVPLAFFGAIFLFTKKNRKELRIMFCLLTAFCILPVAAFVFSGFSSITNRWSFIYAVLTAFLVALCLDQMHTLTRKDILICTGATIYYGLLIYFDKRMQFTTIFADFAFLAVTLCIMLVVNIREVGIPPHTGKLVLGGLTILILAFNGSNFIMKTNSKGKLSIGYTNFDSIKRLEETSLRDIDKIPGYNESKDFFRCTNIRGSSNSNCYSLVKGFNDLSTFSSTLNGSIVDYNRMMGNSDWTMVRIFDYNFRTFMNALASVRYLGCVSNEYASVIPFGYREIYRTKDGLPIYENQYPLPLAYSYDTVVSDSSMLKENGVTRQEVSMHAAIVDDEAMESCSNLKQELEVPLLSHEIPYTADYDGIRIENGMIYFDKKWASMTLHFDSEPNSETYVVFSGETTDIDEGKKDYRSVRITSDDVQYRYAFRTDAYKTGTSQHIFHLGYHTGKIHNCRLKFKLAGSMNCDSIKVYSQPMDGYVEAVNARRADVLEDMTIHNNTITGHVDLDTDKMLVFSLPCQGGWTAYVDGKEVPIYRANYQYMGLNIPKGKHDVRMHYQLSGLKLTFIVTSAGLLIFLAIIIFNLIRKKRQPQT